MSQALRDVNNIKNKVFSWAFMHNNPCSVLICALCSKGTNDTGQTKSIDTHTHLQVQTADSVIQQPAEEYVDIDETGPIDDEESPSADKVHKTNNQ